MQLKPSFIRLYIFEVIVVVIVVYHLSLACAFLAHLRAKVSMQAIEIFVCPASVGIVPPSEIMLSFLQHTLSQIFNHQSSCLPSAPLICLCF